MHHAGLRGAWRGGEEFQAALLPYGNSGMALYAILPEQGVSSEDILAKVSRSID